MPFDATGTLDLEVDASGPLDGALRRELRDEEVVTSCADQRAAAKIDRALEVSDHDDIVGSINRYAAAKLLARITESPALSCSKSASCFGTVSSTFGTTSGRDFACELSTP